MNSPSSDRPNRLAACSICGAKMPQRFLARHQKLHEPTREDAPPEAAQNFNQEQAGTLLCPACGQFVVAADFPDHMTGSHSGWCPLCRTLPRDLLDHLKRSHHLKPLQPFPESGHNWQTQPRYLCLWCKKNVSVASYPEHAKPHGARKESRTHDKSKSE